MAPRTGSPSCSRFVIAAGRPHFASSVWGSARRRQLCRGPTRGKVGSQAPPQSCAAGRRCVRDSGGAARTEGSARFKPAPSAGYRGVVAGPGRRQSALAVGRCAGVPAVRSGPQGPSGASEFWFADSSVRAKDNVLRHVHRKRSAVRRFRGGFACSTEMSSHLFSVLPASSF